MQWIAGTYLWSTFVKRLTREKKDNKHGTEDLEISDSTILVNFALVGFTTKAGREIGH